MFMIIQSTFIFPIYVYYNPASLSFVYVLFCFNDQWVRFYLSIYQQNMFENNMKETNPLEIHDVIVAGGVAVTVKENELILVVEGHVFQVLLHVGVYQS